MEKLSPEQKTSIFKFLDISSLIAAADTSMEFRALVTNKVFLDDFCRRKFGLLVDDLPDLSEYEKLLINTQIMEFEMSKQTKFFGCHPFLEKIYAMELRSSWYPFTFQGSEVELGDEIEERMLKFPWPYQKIGSDFYGQTKKIAAKLHAAFPDLFETFLGNVLMQKDNEKCELAYYVDQYPIILEEAVDAEEDIDFDLHARMPRVIKIIPVGHQDQKFFVLIYDDDQTWVMIHFDGDDEQTVSQFIPWNASVQDVRRLAANVIPNFCSATYGPESLPPNAPVKCPPFGPLVINRQEMHLFQLEMVKILEAAIRSSAHNLLRVLDRVESDQQRRDLLFSKLIPYIDSLYNCADMMHTHCDDARKDASKKLNIALVRALRRLVNDSFVHEVKHWYENPLTNQLCHTWSWQGKGRKKDLCYQTGAPEKFNFKRECYMNSMATEFMCCHRAFADLWPAITLKKAIDAVPKLIVKLDKDTVEFVMRCKR